VDIHSHTGPTPETLDQLVREMDAMNLRVLVNLSGGGAEAVAEKLGVIRASAHADRFAVFANVDWRGAGGSGWAERAVADLEQAVANGAIGLKVAKDLGLSVRKVDGTRLKVDDPVLAPIWEAAGRLDIPVIIHTADPAAFFDPIDETNERWEELSRHPEWSFHGEGFPSREELLSARNRVIARHPDTQFIGAHVANNAEDLSTVARWLDRYPNLWIEPASRISELGRQPFTARAFLIRYADRLLFGTDGPWPETRLRLYWRFFETRDESFPYSEKVPPPQGLWQIYGVDLPDDIFRFSPPPGVEVFTR
jgi:predicted TIM-barrel fold metal-dependent hydrolase